MIYNFKICWKYKSVFYVLLFWLKAVCFVFEIHCTVVCKIMLRNTKTVN